MQLTTLLGVLGVTLATTVRCVAQCESTYLEQIRSGFIKMHDRFGWSVSLRDSAAVIGSPQTSIDPGKAFYYQREPDQWRFRAVVSPSNGAPGDQFGRAVAVDGSVLIVGAPFADRGFDRTGSTYVYVGGGTQWAEITEIVPPSHTAGDEFGASVAISGDKVFVSAPKDDSDVSDGGAVHVYRQDMLDWTLTQTLCAPDPTAGARFGTSLRIVNNELWIGAPGDSTILNDAGAVYVFVQDGGQWQLQDKLVAPVPRAGAQFGYSLDAEDDVLLVGAPYEDSTDRDAGAAYLFERDEGVWSSGAALDIPDLEVQSWAGISVAVELPRVFVALEHRQGDGGFWDPGPVWTYVRRPGGWVRHESLESPDGWGPVAIAGDDLLRGAWNSQWQGTDFGAVHAYELCTVSGCIADWNASGDVNSLDVLAFLSAWTTDDVLADLNADGSVDTFDLLAFLNLWQAGCQ